MNVIDMPPIIVVVTDHVVPESPLPQIMLLVGVASMLEAGLTPPVPARQNVRSEQVNLRLTPEEKAVLESRSRTKGFRGIADYVRAAALSEPSTTTLAAPPQATAPAVTRPRRRKAKRGARGVK
jgi:hypothetical protein